MNNQKRHKFLNTLRSRDLNEGGVFELNYIYTYIRTIICCNVCFDICIGMNLP